MGISGPGFSLRWKLLMLSGVVLIIPYIGYDYLRKMEVYLRDTLESSLVNTAYAVAGALNNRLELFDPNDEENGESLYVHRLEHVVQLDGYLDEWSSYSDWARIFFPKTPDAEDHFKLIISQDKHYYYILIQIHDDTLVYPSSVSYQQINGDHIIIVYRDKFRRLQRIYLAPGAPGLILPFSFQETLDDYGVEVWRRREITNTSAVWQETETGYNLEIKIPEYLVGENLGLIFNDVDDRDESEPRQSITTTENNTFNEPGRLLLSSREIEKIIYTQRHGQGRRIWVLNRAAQVLASDGSLRRVFPDNAFNIIYTLLLPAAYDQFTDDLAGASRLQGAEVRQALAGKTQTRWRSSPGGKAVIVSAATPVWLGDKVAGAVVVEETTNNIQIMQRQVLADLFNKTLLLFFVIVFLLLLFASRLSSRLIKLNKQTAEVIDEYGRVRGNIKFSRAGDEIGELSRNFSSMIERLQHYHHYLEGMTGRLSHELRTPMAIVKSSLERLQEETDEENKAEVLTAADEGLRRLQTLLTRLSEASRLEQALQQAEKQAENINKFLQQCFDGYRLAYPGQGFKLSITDEPVNFRINRDLFFQMLDKLVGNAVEFSEPDKEILIKLIRQNDLFEIQVINHGPTLPDRMADELFNSMISIRKARTDPGPHLGLGLYIARLVAEFHDGKITADDLENKKGVCFKLIFPYSP